MEARYSRNSKALSLNEQKIIRDKTILVIGAGGLGGLLLDHLARLGVKKLKLLILMFSISVILIDNFYLMKVTLDFIK